MEKILKKLKNFGFIKGEHQLLNQDEVEKLKINIEKVLGKNWWKNKELDQSQVITSFKSRMKRKEMDIEKIDDLIVYGKIKETGSPFLFPEIILFREIIFNQTLDEFDHQLKTNQIKIKNLII